MPIKLIDYGSGLDEFAKAIPAAIQGYYDSQAREMKKKEFAAKMAAEEDRKRRNEAELRLKASSQGYELPEGGDESITGLINQGLLQRREGFISPQEMKQLQAKKLMMDIERGPDPYGLKGYRAAKAKREFEQEQKGTKLAPDKVLLVQQGSQIPDMLTDIEDTIKNKADKFGPVKGRVASMNPYDTESQTIDAQMRATSQAFGRYMEGGVLRKEDEEKYRRMFPQLGDTPAVAKSKLAVVNRLLTKKQKEDLRALKAAGYDVSPFKNPNISDLPDELKMKNSNDSDAGNPWDDF